MLEIDRIDISEEIDINKTNISKECDICHYWYFLNKSFNYEPYLCNGCHDLMQKAMNFNDVAVVSIKGNDYRIHFWCLSKDDAISIMHNSNLNDKTGVLFIYIYTYIYIYILLYIYIYIYIYIYYYIYIYIYITIYIYLLYILLYIKK